VTARRFPFRLEVARLLIAGVELANITVTGDVETSGELDEQLARRDQVATPPLPIERVEEPHRGRPSFDSTIAAAVRALGRRLDRRQSRVARARRVLKHLAGTDIEAAAIPKQRTVEDWLAAHEISHGYSRRGKRQPRR
jgi:hypothetical protein